MTRIYLDNAATTPLRPEAAEAMRVGFEIWANPSSPHAEGRGARRALEDARERCKKALGWEGELIFTSGASEALAIGLGQAKVERRIISAVEHDSVFRAAGDAEIVGMGVGYEVDRDELADLLAKTGKAIVAIQHVNSETGTMQPVSKLAKQVRKAGGVLLSDCSQSAGKYNLPDADMIVVSAHKLGGPIGIGALLIRDFAMVDPTGGQERGYRAGTENMPLALGFAAALEAAKSQMRGRLYPKWADGAKSALGVGEAVVIDPNGGHLVLGGDPTINAIFMPGLSAQLQLIRFDAVGMAVSAGSACSSGSLKASRVLKAFGIPDEIANNTIRVSYGWSTTRQDVDQFLDHWRDIAGSVKAQQ